MKKYFLLSTLLVFIGLVINGCSVISITPWIPPRSPVVPTYGNSINITKAPVDITFDKTTIGPKRGESSSYFVFWLVSFGDSGVYAAAREGNIKHVDQIDCEILNVLGFFRRYTTIVYGE